MIVKPKKDNLRYNTTGRPTSTLPVKEYKALDIKIDYSDVLIPTIISFCIIVSGIKLLCCPEDFDLGVT